MKGFKILLYSLPFKHKIKSIKSTLFLLLVMLFEHADIISKINLYYPIRKWFMVHHVIDPKMSVYSFLISSEKNCCYSFLSSSEKNLNDLTFRTG